MITQYSPTAESGDRYPNRLDHLWALCRYCKAVVRSRQDSAPLHHVSAYPRAVIEYFVPLLNCAPSLSVISRDVRIGRSYFFTRDGCGARHRSVGVV